MDNMTPDLVSLLQIARAKAQALSPDRVAGPLALALGLAPAVVTVRVVEPAICEQPTAEG